MDKKKFETEFSAFLSILNQYVSMNQKTGQLRVL